MRLGNLLLKSIPYVLSIAGGVFVFDFSQDYLHDPSWIDLMNNVAASLLAIPLVFLLNKSFKKSLIMPPEQLFA